MQMGKCGQFTLGVFSKQIKLFTELAVVTCMFTNHLNKF